MKATLIILCLLAIAYIVPILVGRSIKFDDEDDETGWERF